MKHFIAVTTSGTGRVHTLMAAEALEKRQLPFNAGQKQTDSIVQCSPLSEFLKPSGNFNNKLTFTSPPSPEALDSEISTLAQAQFLGRSMGADISPFRALQ